VKVGNDIKTYFWSNCWVGAVPLRERFRRLFDLSVYKYKMVADMCLLGWGEGGDAWGWRRRLLAWEEDLMKECISLLSNVTLQETTSDVWQWRPNVVNGYTVCDVYHMLMRQEMHDRDEVTDAIWHRNAPLKVSICVWRLLHNKWPTKDNLVRRGIIQSNSQLCVSGCGNNETADHLAIHCPIFGELWHHVKTWIGVDPQQYYGSLSPV